MEKTKNITFKEPFYYMEDDDVPYCAKCWETDRKTGHVVKVTEGVFDCPSCKYRYIHGNKTGDRYTWLRKPLIYPIG